MVGMETKNADATVAALQTDTVYTLLSPAGITVVPGSVKATLGAPLVPAPAPTDGSAPADGSPNGSTDSATDGSAPTTDGSSDGGGGSNTGAIVGAVVGVVAVVAIGGGIAFVVRPPSPVSLAFMGRAAQAVLPAGSCWCSPSAKQQRPLSSTITEPVSAGRQLGDCMRPLIPRPPRTSPL